MYACRSKSSPNIKYERFFIRIIVEGLHANSGRSLSMDEGNLHVGVDFKYKGTKKPHECFLYDPSNKLEQ